MEDDTLSTGELAGRQGHTGRHGHDGEPSAEPDVLLDVPQLSVEEIILEVEDLRAHVSIEANVLNLLRLSVGADMQLGSVHLDIKGVEAQALLKVRLDKVAEIINRVLLTIDRNPEIVAQATPPLRATASEPEGTVGRSVDEVAGVVGSAAPDLDRSVAEMIGGPDGSGATVEEQAVAEALQHEAEPIGANEGTPPGLQPRRKQLRNTSDDLIQMRTVMISRACIEQANGILMERNKITEDEAYTILTHASQRTNIKLRDVAEELVRTGTLPS